MGVINVTPDSFSGDGVSQNVDEALALASNFKDFGVDIIDIGGESTRPSSRYTNVKDVTVQEEISRVIPVISQIKKHFDIPISIDSRRAPVVNNAIEVGADMINDVSMMNYDPEMINVISDLSIPFVLTHNKKIKDGNVVKEIKRDFEESISKLRNTKFDLSNLIIDPGIGFNKSSKQSILILRELDKLKFGFPLLIGTSRKSHIGDVLNLPVSDRLEGTAATVSISIDRGADIIRVHDVKEMVRVAKMTDAISRGFE
ncbi:MAG: dihydropteroate synthase [Chloroflexi bacterium]|nr:dihydropteroate synthase [Chloroflexota bacterium]|tara:strand:+ start:4805 stop:5578 length:774 start_codon:yes stop_codon:yes gene_type:complete